MSNVNGTIINLMPTEGMRKEAKRYRKWKEDGESGGTEVAQNRATQILSGNELSPKVVIEMSAWFARHLVDKQGKGFSPSEEGYPSNGRVAWAAWGGDSGQSWSTMKSETIKKAQDRALEESSVEPSAVNEEVRAEPDALDVGDFVSWNSSGGRARGRIVRVVKDGSIDVPGSSFTINGTSDDPAALITVYRDGEETDTKVGHKFSTLTKIEPIRMFEGSSFKRAESTEFLEAEDRTLEFPFASEQPVERYFGMEVLSMSEEAMDLSRLNDGAPLLYQHDADKIVGVVERAYIKDKRGYAKVKLANNELGREMQDLVKDGIIRNVSFGYRINEMEEDKSTKPATYRATAYQPFEISLVTVPADQTVGIGRAFAESQSVPAASTVTTPPLISTMEEQTPNLELLRAEASEAKAKEAAEMLALGKRTQNVEIAQDFVMNSRSLDELRSALLEKMGSQSKPVDNTAGEIGLSEKETRSFSWLRAINYLSNPADRAAREAAGFEIEASDAAAAKLGRQSRGITIPQDVLRRDLATSPASAGGNLVSTDLLAGSFIDLLRNASALDRAGATVLTGLTGNVAIPRQSGAATAYWVAESGAPSESQQTLDQVTMMPRTVAAYTDYSRRLLIQSSVDVENMVRSDLAKVLALKIDLAGLYGTGTNSEPLGLKNTTGIGTEDFAANTPTFAEVVALESDVAGANALLGSPVYLMNAAMRGALKTAVKESGQASYIYENNEVNGYRGDVSNQVESNDLWFGNFADLLIGYFSGLDLMVDPYSNSTSGTVRVVAMQDVDMAVRHPESFSRGNNTL
jgi:HK97 family phage major capsid protein/HK97 family phage prohead protease|tara:strand:+ start:2497 stop:4908 length:2412 start_codon:yes stop_codon:yes gene_type:complete